jgi:hypothetical protein
MVIVNNKEQQMSKTFGFAGTCVVEGVSVYKFANDANRAAVLAKLGATDVNIIALPQAMNKDDAVAYLASQGLTAGWRRAAAIAKAPKVAKVVTPVAKGTAKRVGDKCPKNLDPEEFVRRWFAQKEVKLGDRFAAKKAA